jgi:lysophospholipase L1-like esterase
MTPYTYLALGDSYTIGEQVPLADSFPYQTVQLIRNNMAPENLPVRYFCAPEIIATTGWTTDELQAAIDRSNLFPAYDFVSLLIGVNNQYRGRDVENFKIEFEQLLKRAIQFAGDQPKNVFVLSIPDWGITPFAADRDISKIALEIDQYNRACNDIAMVNQVMYIDITSSQRLDGHTEGFVAADGLHPSGKEYTKWAGQLSKAILERIA